MNGPQSAECPRDNTAGKWGTKRLVLTDSFLLQSLGFLPRYHHDGRSRDQDDVFYGQRR